jgi:hypothetical protein
MINLPSLVAAPLGIKNSFPCFMYILIYGHKSDLKGEESAIGRRFYSVLSNRQQPSACKRNALHLLSYSLKNKMGTVLASA